MPTFVWTSPCSLPNHHIAPVLLSKCVLLNGTGQFLAHSSQCGASPAGPTATSTPLLLHSPRCEPCTHLSPAPRPWPHEGGAMLVHVRLPRAARLCTWHATRACPVLSTAFHFWASVTVLSPPLSPKGMRPRFAMPSTHRQKCTTCSTRLIPSYRVNERSNEWMSEWICLDSRGSWLQWISVLWHNHRNKLEVILKPK